ncbi:MAG: hypothetical protein R3E77_01430 [Steroidobacteraceae bacterium]
MIDYEKLGAFYLGKAYDPAAGRLAEEPLLYDSKDLTTHAVCVGMTGSGKTGLCLTMLEEAAIDGIPAIAIDPKGDIANLALRFPQLQPQDFEPWVDAAEAARKNVSVAQLAAATATKWREGLAEWQQEPARIERFRAAAAVDIYTPGATTGLALSVLRSFAPPPDLANMDPAALRERINGVTAGLLGLIGRDADPLQSRDHILIANIIDAGWRDGQTLDMPSLINRIQKPPFDKVGAFDLETFYPASERTQLAMSINNLLASPGFSAWMQGAALDVQQLLFGMDGKPRIAVISIAHLGDAERMFVVTLILNELIAWMRRQSGTGALRALLYMDEIFGFFPPSANPPSKVPMLTLLKQARAFGVGCILATQNPVDLDYKGLSNCGTWFIGRLQTERDKQRVVEGLQSALAGSSEFDKGQIDSLISQLEQRVFFMRNVHDDAPLLFKSRWALSYLRGPLTGAEITRVMQGQRAVEPAAAANIAAPLATAVAATGTAARPNVPAGVKEYFLGALPGDGAIVYRPMLLGRAKLHFVDSKRSVDQWSTLQIAAPLNDDGSDALWDEAANIDPALGDAPTTGATFADLPAAALRSKSYDQYGKSLAANLYEKRRAIVFGCRELGQHSNPDETESDFRARLAHTAREQRDAAVAELRKKYADRASKLQDSLRRAEDKVEVQKSQVTQQKMQTALSVGAGILGALLGRRRVTAGNIGRVVTAARSASRIGREKDDVTRASESAEVLRSRLADLERECAAEIDRLGADLDASTIALERTELAPRKSDIAIGEIALLWMPFRKGSDGFPAPAYQR